MTDIEKTGAILLGIVGSARQPLTVSELERDYESMTGKKLTNSGDKWPWHQSDRFWHDFSGFIHKTTSGHIVAKTNVNNRSLLGLVESTKKSAFIPMSKVVKQSGPLFPAAAKRLESTRIESTSGIAIDDYQESSSDSSIVSEEEDYQITLPTTELNDTESLPLTLRRSSSLETIAAGETNDDNVELYDDIDECREDISWRKHLVRMNIMDLIFQFPNGVKRRQFWIQVRGSTNFSNNTTVDLY